MRSSTPSIDAFLNKQQNNNHPSNGRDNRSSTPSINQFLLGRGIQVRNNRSQSSSCLSPVVMSEMEPSEAPSGLQRTDSIKAFLTRHAQQQLQEQQQQYEGEEEGDGQYHHHDDDGYDYRENQGYDDFQEIDNVHTSADYDAENDRQTEDTYGENVSQQQHQSRNMSQQSSGQHSKQISHDPSAAMYDEQCPTFEISPITTFGGATVRHQQGSGSMGILAQLAPQPSQQEEGSELMSHFYNNKNDASERGTRRRQRRQHTHLDIDPNDDSLATRGAIPVPERYKHALENHRKQKEMEKTSTSFFQQTSAEENEPRSRSVVSNMYTDEELLLLKIQNARAEGERVPLPSSLTNHYKRLHEHDLSNISTSVERARGQSQSSLGMMTPPRPKGRSESSASASSPPLAAVSSPYRGEERKTRLAKLVQKETTKKYTYPKADSYEETRRAMAALPTMAYISPQQREHLRTMAGKM